MDVASAEKADKSDTGPFSIFSVELLSFWFGDRRRWSGGLGVRFDDEPTAPVPIVPLRRARWAPGRTSLVVAIVVLLLAGVSVLAWPVVFRPAAFPAAGGEVYRESTSDPGRDPFSGTVVVGNPPGTKSQTPIGTPGDTIPTISGDLPALYGGSRNEHILRPPEAHHLPRGEPRQGGGLGRRAGHRPGGDRHLPSARSPRCSCAPTPASPTTASSTDTPPPCSRCCRRAPPYSPTTTADRASSADAATRSSTRSPPRSPRSTPAMAGPTSTRTTSPPSAPQAVRSAGSSYTTCGRATRSTVRVAPTATRTDPRHRPPDHPDADADADGRDLPV